jgi:predicted transcriptional regulator
MKFRMDKTLRFWVDCSYEDKRRETANRTRAELIAEILREYERDGDAMRYLSVEGKIAWKASPSMLRKLADAEREVEDDMADFP